MKRLMLRAVVLVLAVAGAACGGGDDSSSAGAELGPPSAANGEKVFESTCLACHGQDGVGIDGLGKPMPGSAFIASLSDTELVDFVKTGRSASDPDNTTGVDMPANGGRDLSEQELVDVVAYIRTLG